MLLLRSTPLCMTRHLRFPYYSYSIRSSHDGRRHRHRRRQRENNYGGLVVGGFAVVGGVGSAVVMARCEIGPATTDGAQRTM